MTSLGFETLLINNEMYDKESLEDLFSLFVPCGIRNFVFLSSFDLAANSFPIELQRLKGFRNFADDLLPRGFHAYTAFNLMLSEGCAFNRSFNRIYSNKKQKALLAVYPAFSEKIRYELSKDINQMIYKLKAFTVLTNFETVIETSHKEAYSKLFYIKNFAYGFDINYLLRKDRQELLNYLIDNNILFMPMVSHHSMNYVEIMNRFDELFDIIGKKRYFAMLRNISKCSEKIGF